MFDVAAAGWVGSIPPKLGRIEPARQDTARWVTYS
jgi:hypothetical protein